MSVDSALIRTNMVLILIFLVVDYLSWARNTYIATIAGVTVFTQDLIVPYSREAGVSEYLPNFFGKAYLRGDFVDLVRKGYIVGC